MTLLDPRPRLDPAVVRRIRGWARERWGDDAAITVTELRCAEPGCPPLETVIVVAPSDGPTFQHKVHAPAAEISRGDVLEPELDHDH